MAPPTAGRSSTLLCRRCVERLRPDPCVEALRRPRRLPVRQPSFLAGPASRRRARSPGAAPPAIASVPIYDRHALDLSARAGRRRADPPRHGRPAPHRPRAQRVGARAGVAPRTHRRAALRAPPDRRRPGALPRRARRAHARRPEHRLRSRRAARRARARRAPRSPTDARQMRLTLTARGRARGARHRADGAGTARRRPRRARRDEREALAQRARGVARGRAGSPRCRATMFFEEAIDARPTCRQADGVRIRRLRTVPPDDDGRARAARLRARRSPHDRSSPRSPSALAVAAALAAQLLTRLIGARHEPRLLRPVRRRARARPPAAHRPALGAGAHPDRRRADRRADGALRLGGDPRPRHPRGDGARAVRREPHPGARARSSSRSRRRSRSAPAARSAPRGRSSRPAARSARSSGSSSTSRATSGRRCSPPAPPRAWRRPSAAR